MIKFFLVLGIIICFLLIVAIIVAFAKGRIYDKKFLKRIAFLSAIGAVVYTTLAVMESKATESQSNIIFYVVLAMAIILLLIKKK